MNVFDLKQRLVADYASYVRSFIRIRDTRIEAAVDYALSHGLLWPEPLVQLNPAFLPGPLIDDLVADGTLHPKCAEIFRLKTPEDAAGRPLRLHRHQADAVTAAGTGKSYVLTTGTGSGKSLAYIVPIVDHVLRRGSGQGIQAIVVYPMNALANSQENELKKFLGEENPAVTFAQYTGQRTDDREDIIEHPPDILLTNFVMLELLLTRPRERKLIEAAKGLRFLVLDELHTYRGRQGADVGLLVRRVRQLLAAPDLQCVGTSATLAGPGTPPQQREQVARAASLLFGTDVAPQNVISESLRRLTPERDVEAELAGRIPELGREPERSGEGMSREAGDRTRVRSAPPPVPEPPPSDFASFVQDPLATWIESKLGITRRDGSLVRANPRSIVGPDGLSAELAALTGRGPADCREAVEQTLLAGYACVHPETGFPVFAFRLHQFISRGDTVYASLDRADHRHITLSGQQFVPGDRSRVLLPLVFCRECGQEYACVRDRVVDGTRTFTRRELSDRFNDADLGRAGFLFFTEDWPEDEQEVAQRLPDDWVEEKKGLLRVRYGQRQNKPEPLYLNGLGQENPAGLRWFYLPSPFRFCVRCGVTYGGRASSDFGKLSTLASEGRSTATTILSLSCVRALRHSSLKEAARKLLSFTDNRQDASLQAGHFNDFIEVGLLRSALYRAAAAGPAGVRHEELTQRVFQALAMPLTEYAVDPEVRFNAKLETERALREVIGYRLYRDLERGWRITSPNLEQCGLLEIRYESLEDLCRAEEEWSSAHSALRHARPETRERVARALLDFMRRRLAIKVSCLDPTDQERIQKLSEQRLQEPWCIDAAERLERARILFPRAGTADDPGEHLFVSPRGVFGQFLKRPTTFPDYAEKIDAAAVLRNLLEILRVAGLVERVVEPRGESDVAGWQVPAAALIWMAGDGTRAMHDPVQVPRASSEGGNPNAFFVEFYRTIAPDAVGLKAREHTAQVPSDERQQREQDFRAAALPILYCSPTMELGVDIAELNAVNMRNVPPTPASYAQRSGRAGRSGQPALVFTYCSSGSPHDQYFFVRPEIMVAGAVTPPRLDLANEDLVRAHVHAVWLGETRVPLGNSVAEILDVDGPTPTLALKPAVRDHLSVARAREEAREHARGILASIREWIEPAPWFHDGWLDDILDRAVEHLDEACERWRSLWKAATAQIAIQHAIANDPSRDAREREAARRLRQEAEIQRDLLYQNDNVFQSDFYSYRYFASEGFLPGYNFPRLPLSAFIPARRKGREDQYISRPRFLAISEFGPRALIYHEGSRYVINKVILPSRGSELQLMSLKQCRDCGYLHPVTTSPGPDLCEHCREPLDLALPDLLRLQNVSTRRRDRISSDEEERVRMGYEVRSGIRFAEIDGRLAVEEAVVHASMPGYAKLIYAHAANIWRINFGWRRRKNRDDMGFVIDTERGFWQANKDLQDAGEDHEDDLGRTVRRVVPYVEDHRNCLLLRPPTHLKVEQLTSLRAALKNAIQVKYQVEDGEIAAELLPSLPYVGTGDFHPRILFYEAAEGGAGVLRALVDDATALPDVARTALELCHFDPATGEDLRRGPRAREDCEAACYDCLMSYNNQPDHAKLDRQEIFDVLTELMNARVEMLPRESTWSERFDALFAAIGHPVLAQWLEQVRSDGFRPPDEARPELFGAAPDFVYRLSGSQAAIYVDGSDPDRARRDRAEIETLEDVGFMVIRFGDPASWDAILRKYPSFFGEAPPAPAAPPTVDLDLFPAAWHSFIERVPPGVQVEPGGDITADGAVVGRYVMELSNGETSLRIVDAADPPLKNGDRRHYFFSQADGEVPSLPRPQEGEDPA